MGKTKLGKFTVVYTNKQEYHFLKREIFISNSYYFPKVVPKIIVDLGAHIGLSGMYFRKMYPNSTIIAFEPNPQVFEILKDNIFGNKIKNVLLQNTAISHISGEVPFYIDSTENNWFSTGGMLKGSWQGIQQTKEIKVKSVKLSEILDINVDILKMDIEGEEQNVLEEAEKKLNNVDNICIEFHPTKGNSYIKIIEILKDKGFIVSIFRNGKKLKRYDKKGLAIIKGERKC